MSTPAARVAGLLAPARETDTPDEELVRRFAADRDGPAFVALVRRHGPMVFGVCRRVLRDWHLAEDAFQAAFLVLARRASAISPPGAVAGWLHGVAYRVSKDARRSALRHSGRERPAGELPEPAAPAPEPPDGGLRDLIDAELQKLPAKYRELLVACDLEGRPRQPVAEALGIPEGTLSSRLTAARRMLAERLARRGVAPAVAAAVAAGHAGAEACEVPRPLSASAARIGSDPAGAVPAQVAALADGAIRAMSTSKLKLATVALAAAALGGLGAAYAGGLLTAPPADPPRVAAPTPDVKPVEGSNRILFFRDRQLTTIDPDGKNDKTVSRERGLFQPVEARLSPDGKRLAVRIKAEFPDDPNPDEPTRFWLYIRELGEKEPGTFLDVFADTFAWSPDGTEIAYTGPGVRKPGEKVAPTVHGVVNVGTKKTTAVKLPADHAILDWSRDGKFFLTRRTDNSRDLGPGQLPLPTMTLHLMNRDGTEHNRLTGPKETGMFGRLSPDGKCVLYYGTGTPEMKDDPGNIFHLWVLNLGTMKAALVQNVPDGGTPVGMCWSPDGKRIAYAWREFPRFKNEDDRKELRVVACDPDGKNAKTVASEQAKVSPVFGDVDWR